ncbi:LacI family DNA-binding transcriptional regulator [Flexivirga caeni]|uniref:LacI family transcriptional regulator n=1 Tax=Flexivirga caeni TaxID=2294115 RepID=A0A3M9MID9_9MICO|nr:LacI family DNA-binding transcriptional regulator [Flexivirga caeni]RNI25276.1 LacI family transcriptional regulator [Flexivirga caeni]
MASQHRAKPATAQDVADLAGSSRTAVSFVLNNKAQGNVSEATRERILKAAAELDYRPHPVAQSLRTQRTHLIGVITDAIASSPFAGQLISGATELALQQGYLAAVFDSNGQPEAERRAAREFRRRRVDGLIYASMTLREVSDVPDAGLPTVLANCFTADDRLASLIPDEDSAGAAAAELLVSLGHRRIAMISGGRAIAGRMRQTAFVERLAASGQRPAVRVLPGEWTIDAGYDAAIPVLDVSRATRPTALFCVNDRVAAGALLAATRLGLRVPAELSILGFDDQEELAGNLVPALTTFALPHRSMGICAMETLIAQLAARTQDEDPTDRAPRRRLLESVLVRRESVGPAPV